jgi:hypothetical protein
MNERIGHGQLAVVGVVGEARAIVVGVDGRRDVAVVIVLRLRDVVQRVRGGGDPIAGSPEAVRGGPTRAEDRVARRSTRLLPL